MDSNSLYTIEVLDKGKTLNEVLKEHDMGLSAAIIERVCYAKILQKCFFKNKIFIQQGY